MITFEQEIRNSRRDLVLQRDVNLIFNILRDYIPRDCEQNALTDLTNAFDRNGLELTSRHEREQYEAVMKLCADGAKYEEILKAGKFNAKDILDT